jgi:hypothetical protein
MTSETIQVKFERRIFKFQLKERANIDFMSLFRGMLYVNYQNPKSTLISKRVNDDARRGNRNFAVAVSNTIACICDMTLEITSADAEVTLKIRTDFKAWGSFVTG